MIFRYAAAFGLMWMRVLAFRCDGCRGLAGLLVNDMDDFEALDEIEHVL
jgi:hypothetical protein